MIKFFGLIPRRADISPEEFHDHYRHPHGTLGRQITTFRGYVQSHQIASPRLGPDQTQFEAVAEVWFDTVADAEGLADHPQYVAHVQPDEPNFVDLERLKWLYTTEEVVISGPDVNGEPAERALQAFHLQRPTTVKILHFSESDEGLARPAEEAAALAHGVKAARYVRCRPHEQIHADEPPAFAGVQELWWPTVWDFEAGSSVQALDELLGAGGVTLLAQAERFM
jgi:uncharacterized protein (TIGR02118 family)